MDNIFIKDFSAGWIPSDSPIGGRRNGLLQMDNLELDKNGAIVMSGGTVSVWSGFSANAHSMYSRVVGGSRRDYSADTSGGIFRNTTNIGSGGDAVICAFGSAFDYVLACSGATRKKDSGSGTPTNLGIAPSGFAPTIFVNATNAPYQIIGDVISSYATPFGSSTVVGTYNQLTADADGKAVIQTFGGGVPRNASVLTGIGAGNVGYSTDNDYIILCGYLVDPFNKSLQLDILLEAGNSSGDQVGNFYKYVVNDLGNQANFTTTGLFSLKIRRSDFERIGNSAADWTTCYGFRITFQGEAGEIINILGNGTNSSTMYIIGGNKAQFGDYQYMQINVNNTGTYIGKSPIGSISPTRTIDMCQALVNPFDPTAFDSQCNEAWVYRRGGLLDDWYLVKKFVAPYTPDYDTLSDLDALKLNIKFNSRLVSIASSSISEKIISIVGPLEGRWLYFTPTKMYPSDINNPDLVDPNLAIQLTGSSSEVFLNAKQVGEKSVLVATSVDFYLLSGTFITQPDFTVDIYYSGFGTEYPALTYNLEENDNSVVYMAKDGWRTFSLNGQSILLTAPNTDRLYRGQPAAGYVAPNLNIVPGTVKFPVVISKNKLWCFVTGTGRIEVFDFARQYWRTAVYNMGDVSAACSTQDGRILAFYQIDRRIREIDRQDTKLIDGTSQQIVNFQTLVFDNNTPKQRKDSYDLKVRLYTSNGTANIAITDDNQLTHFVSAQSGTYVSDVNLDISTIVGLVRTYQVKLTCQSNDFELTDIEFVFDTRPPQVSFIRVLANNYGTSARKRIAAVPFVIDSLGNNFIFTPYIDGFPYPPIVYNTFRKQSIDYDFITTPGLGVDWEYTISAPGNKLFEFFGMLDPKIVEVFPLKSKVYVVPVTNFGNAQKKRVRVWPCILSAPGFGTNVQFTPTVDGTITQPSIFNPGLDRQTFRHYFKTDVFGVDYSGVFISDREFEVTGMMEPDIVQTLPIAKQFDQVGPLELFRYAKLIQLEYRVVPFGNSIPYTIYFNDGTEWSENLAVEVGVDKPYYIDIPKGVTGNVVRITFGPTNFDIHRMSARVKCTITGKDTESAWVDLG